MRVIVLIQEPIDASVDQAWSTLAAEQFLAGYSAEDAIYDEIELQPGEPFILPPDWVTALGAGRWKITIEPASLADAAYPIRAHGAFLNSYTTQDEGLYC